ncbi:MAG: hypothetical protein AAFV72_21170 [Cyanobacteria bacterium J06635_1]
MNRFPVWLALPVLALLGAPVYAQAVAQTPLNASIQVTGNSGGGQTSSCGNIAANPNQQLRVTEPFASLNVEVSSTGDYTLFITGPNNFSECVLAHDFDGGIIQSPGVLNQGLYKIYVGDRNGASHPFTLEISQ